MDAIRPAKPALLLIMKCIYFQNLKWILNWIGIQSHSLPISVVAMFMAAENLVRSQRKRFKSRYRSR